MQACVRTANRRDEDPRRAHIDRFAAARSGPVIYVASLTKVDTLVSSRALDLS